MRLKLWTAVALLLLLTFPVLAAEQEKQPAMDPAMMEAMMKAGTPGEPHKKLDAFAGSWETKATFWMAPGTEPMTMQGASENKWILGGRFLEQRFSGAFFGNPFEGIGFTGYDNVKGQYWGSWMDNMSTAMMVSTGTSSDGRTWEFTGTMSDPMTGKDARVDEKIVIVDADHHTMEMWAPGPDGKMFKNMELTYTRKK